MVAAARFLAVDMGASNGRVLACGWNGTSFSLDELHRFDTGGVRVGDSLHWDVMAYWREILHGLAAFEGRFHVPPSGISIDAWGVDFALLDEHDNLIQMPHHYRDGRTVGALSQVFRHVSSESLFLRTGVQPLRINTLFQLYSMVDSGDPQLERARTLLLIPDFLHHRLSGAKFAEWTAASTTQMLAAGRPEWENELLQGLQLPVHLLPSIIEPGTIVGTLRPAVARIGAWKMGIPIVAGASHDTASAVAAIPGLDEDSAFLCSGTWSLIGVETDDPLVTSEAWRLRFTNEAGAGGRNLLLRNATGLWLIQECRRQWGEGGSEPSWDDLLSRAAASEPLVCLIDTDSERLLTPKNMPEQVREECRRTGQVPPDSMGAIVRCCLESLCLCYRRALDDLEALTARKISTLRMVGGGCHNHLLCQWTADATRRMVVTGPVEASAMGNSMLQAVATGHLDDLRAGRAAIQASTQFQTYLPADAERWEAGYRSLLAIEAARP